MLAPSTSLWIARFRISLRRSPMRWNGVEEEGLALFVLAVKVASHKVILLYLYQRRLLAYAPVMSVRTARVKPTSRRRIHRTGNLTTDNLSPPVAWLGNWNSGYKRFRIRMKR